jgi:hypothetical protein
MGMQQGMHAAVPYGGRQDARLEPKYKQYFKHAEKMLRHSVDVKQEQWHFTLNVVIVSGVCLLEIIGSV